MKNIWNNVEIIPLSTRFWSKVQKGEPEACWVWLGGKAGPYGMLGGIGVHVIAYTLTFGDVPEGNCVRHSCNNKLCVNPEHLKVGTQRENLLDQVAAGNRKAFVSLEQRAEIVKLRAEGLTLNEISKRFGGLDRSYICKIGKGMMPEEGTKKAGRPKIPVMVRFMSKVQKGTETECWLWVGATSRSGHGRFLGQNAHRWYYKQEVGPVPDDIVLSHQCDQPLCVNPKHLKPTTNAENIKEMWERQRAAYQRPEYAERREAVRKLYAAGERSPKAIADTLNIPYQEAKYTLYNIRRPEIEMLRSTPDSGPKSTPD